MVLSFLEPSLPSAVRKIFVMLWVVLPAAAQPIASQKSCELPKAARVQEKKNQSQNAVTL